MVRKLREATRIPAPDARDNPRIMPPRPPLTVVRLSDHFGQYILLLMWECGHTRTAQPQTLAALAGWDALLAVSSLLKMAEAHPTAF
jgi:hypothetical protein